MEHEELTEEQQHYAAMEVFVCDVRNIRFVESRENWATINDFLTEHSLDVTAENLNFAFAALCTDGLLELMPLGHAAPPQPPQPEAPAPTPAGPARSSSARESTDIPHVSKRQTNRRGGAELMRRAILRFYPANSKFHRLTLLDFVGVKNRRRIAKVKM